MSHFILKIPNHLRDFQYYFYHGADTPLRVDFFQKTRKLYAA